MKIPALNPRLCIAIDNQTERGESIIAKQFRAFIEPYLEIDTARYNFKIPMQAQYAIGSGCLKPAL
nr:hypothetical protein [uncultured Pseudomonas sp.]